MFIPLDAYSCCSSPWIGLSDIAQESDWRWVNNDVLAYSGWKSIEPNGYNVQNCVKFFSDGTWDDDRCDLTFPYVCSSLGTSID